MAHTRQHTHRFDTNRSQLAKAARNKAQRQLRNLIRRTLKAT